MYKVTFSKQAYKSLRRMPANVAEKIAEKIKRLALDPHKMPNVKKLTNHPGYRLRVADWRVVYTLHDRELRIHVIKIASRGEVYK